MKRRIASLLGHLVLFLPFLAGSLLAQATGQAAKAPATAADPMASYMAKLKKEDPDLVASMIGFMRELYPTDRSPRAVGPASQTRYVIQPNNEKQIIKGIGFEIMSDSIGSGNRGLPEEPIGIPHDLVPEERDRLCREMLKGFRYCRLAGGLYWRGLDQDQKQLKDRWPGQLAELHEMMTRAGIEGVSFEYWSPAPFWKANRKYTGADGSENRLRCFGSDFKNDPIYHGDVDRFLGDFAEACVNDLKTLQAAGIPVIFWNLQNEPFDDAVFPTCRYTVPEFAQVFRAVVPRIRSYDPKIKIIADTGLGWDFRYIRPVLNDPEQAKLVDALPIHLIGVDSKYIRPPVEPSGKPRYNNEFEYLMGATSPARCLNTVQYVMNWMQLGDAPTWFWIHALKPIQNSEASGYSLGFWRPSNDLEGKQSPPGLKPGHWVWNKYNWYAVGSFLRHMPWDCRSVALREEDGSDDDLRIMAFKRPNGKLTVMLSNRSFVPHTFILDTGLEGRKFLGYRYTPESAGPDLAGVPVGEQSGRTISPLLPDMSWEFWEEQ